MEGRAEQTEDHINIEYLNNLLEMGIPINIATKALRKTNGLSLDVAVSKALELTELDSDDENWEDLNGSYKMVFVVNSVLSMGVGKIAAQVAHAALGLYRLSMTDQLECAKLTAWQEEGEKKVVLRGNDENHLKELSSLAIKHGVPQYVVQDAGLTEIPANSLTVLGLFGSEEEVDKITKSLRLL